MDTNALKAIIDRFNEANDPFAIGMNFIVAGIGSLQTFLKHVEGDSIDLAVDKKLLDEAEEMLSFGASQVERATSDAALLRFLARYRGFIAELKNALSRGARENEG